MKVHGQKRIQTVLEEEYYFKKGADHCHMQDQANGGRNTAYLRGTGQREDTQEGHG